MKIFVPQPTMNQKRIRGLKSFNQRKVEQDANTGQAQLEFELFDGQAYFLLIPPEPEEEPFNAREFLLSTPPEPEEEEPFSARDYLLNDGFADR
jgi:hypothetical protein